MERSKSSVFKSIDMERSKSSVFCITSRVQTFGEGGAEGE